MISIFKSKKLCYTIIAIVLIYAIISCLSQQKKLDNYSQQKKYYESQISSLNEDKEELLEEKANIDSPEYIEKQAREKLDMYYPNERVYIAQGN